MDREYLESLTDAELEAWVQFHAPDLTQGELAELQSYLRDVRSSGSDSEEIRGAEEVVASRVQSVDQTRPPQPYMWLDDSPDAKAALADQAPDLSGWIRAARSSQRAQGELDRLMSEAEELKGEPLSPAEQREVAASAGVSASAIPRNVLPRWTERFFGSRMQTAEEQQRTLEYINDAYDLDATSLEDPRIVRAFESPTAKNEAILEMAILDNQPVPAFQVALPGGRQPYTITTDQFQAVSELYSLTPDALVGLVRRADHYGMYYGNGGSGDTSGVLYWQVLPGLMRAAGIDGDLVEAGQRQAAAEAAEARDPFPHTAPWRAGDLRAVDSVREDPAPVAKGDSRMGFLDRRYRRPTQARLAYDFNMYMDRYQDPGMALIGTLDPALASRLHTSIRQGVPVSGKDEMLVSVLANKAGFKTTEEWQAAVVGTGDGRMADSSGDFFSRHLDREAERVASERMRRDQGRGRGGGGGGGGYRTQPDPEAVKQAAKDLYRQFFMEDPSDERLAEIGAQIASIVSGTPLTEGVDVQARIRAIMEKDPLYETYYGNRPDGVTEQEYQGQMLAGQASMLGNEIAGNAAAKAGMMGGQYQTSVGAAMGTAEAWDNSTFMGRLARAAQTVGANT